MIFYPVLVQTQQLFPYAKTRMGIRQTHEITDLATVVSKLLEQFILSNIFTFLETTDNQVGLKA